MNNSFFTKASINILWLFFDKAIRIGLGIFIGAWVARYLGPDGFGKFNYATSMVALFTGIATLGLPNVAVRDIVTESSSASEILGTTAALQVVGGLISYCALIVFMFLLRPDDAETLTIGAILGLALLVKFLEVATYWFESRTESKYIVYVTNFVFVSVAGIKILMIELEASIYGFAWAQLCEIVIGSVLLYALFAKRKKIIGPLTLKFKRARELLKESWPLMLSSISIMIYMKIDLIMLGSMGGDIEAGVFGAATRISEIFYFVPIVIITSVFPKLLQIKEQDREAYDRKIQKLFDIMTVLSLLIAVTVTFSSSAIVNVLYGNAYKSAGLVLAVHVWSSVFVFLGVVTTNWLLSERLQHIGLQRTVLGALINIFLNLMLIPRFGPIGAASATVFSQFCVGILFDAFNTKTNQLLSMKLNSLNPFRMVGYIKRYVP